MLGQVSKRSLQSSYQRILNNDNKAIGALKNIYRMHKNIMKNSLHAWQKFNSLCKNETILNMWKTERMRFLLQKIILKRKKIGYLHIIQDKHLKDFKVKTKLNILAKIAIKRNHDAIKRWHLNTVENTLINNNKITQNLLLAENKGIKMKYIIKKILQARFKSIMIRIIPSITKISQVFSFFESLIQRKTRNTLHQWAKYIEKVRKNELLSNVAVLNLKKSLESLLLRRLRDYFLRFSGDGSRTKGAIRSLVYKTMKRLSISYTV